MFDRLMDDFLDGKSWARAVIFVAVLVVALVGIRIAFGVTWIDVFDAFD